MKRFREDVAEIENFRALLGRKNHLRPSHNIKSTLADNLPPSISTVVSFKKKLARNKNKGKRTAKPVYIGKGKHKNKIIAMGIKCRHKHTQHSPQAVK